ncbi:hypothetical protein BD410DRAFT_582526 [Rickenella mellea]|uniref:Uncharacterized protein n=2 Tax=Rickenella mellea TaxID=50990 RepID=A0A4Y7PQ45_9AGAM|nr:hypothetical protein BD410DRAFT_582526 [Rickenella mellea]
MPSASRTQHKAEAKYNVTTDFPRLDLHSAAAAGNLGLVEYAIRHGQPVNSVLDGVLPLHAAAAGGSVVVVLYLIDQGADVNVPRLPRRYSNEKKSDTGGLIVGSSGSTPLHFASANGHTPVVRILLEHGAHPERADKHGVTPEMLARDNGWAECADVIREWSGEREADLPSSEKHDGSKQYHHHHHHHLHLKRSIDETIHLLTSHHCHPHHNNASSNSSPPFPNREPSSSFTPHSHLHIKSASSRRPKSAGTNADADREKDGSANVSDGARKLTNKFSLLHLLKKDSASGAESAQHSRDSSPARKDFDRTALSHVQGPTNTNENKAEDHEKPPSWFRARTGSESALRGARVGTSLDLGMGMGMGLHHAMSSESLRRVGRSPLGTPLILDHRAGDDGGDDEDEDEDEEDEGVVKRRPSLRHHRTSSSQSHSASHSHSPTHSQSQTSSPSLYPKGAKLIRFNSSGQYGNGTPAPSMVAQILGRRPSRTFGLRGGGGQERRVRGCMSVGSLRGRFGVSNDHDKEGEGERKGFSVHLPPESAPALRTRFGSDVGDGGGAEDEKDEGSSKRRRGASFASSISSSDAQRPSPNPGEAVAEVVSESTPTDFHFTISTPPPLGSSPRQINDSQTLNSRRRDSVSSTDTDASGADDHDAQRPIHSSLLLTPPLSSPNPPHQSVDMLVNGFSAPPIYTHREGGGDGDSPSSSLEDLDFSLSSSRYNNASLRSTITNSTSVRDDLDLDLHTVSSRAEAEALVQKTQASILQLAESMPDGERSPEIDRVPLSARLAAYGEVLALERRFAKGERQRELWAARSDSEEEGEGGGGEAKVVVGAGSSAYGTPRSPRPRVVGLESPPLSKAGNRVIPTRSISNPVEYDTSSSDEPPPAVVDVVETPPTPVDSKSPQYAKANLRVQSHRSNPSLRPPPPINLSLANESVPSLPSITAGAPLTRVSTAPLQETKTQIDLVSAPEALPKHKGSATKLARMGFTADDGNIPVTLPMTPPPSSKASSKRFVGIKSLMLNLKGKS